MKRYTGQQALYEAISRSRAKAKQGSILDKLLPDHAKQETATPGPVPPVEPQHLSPASGVEPVQQTPVGPEIIRSTSTSGLGASGSLGSMINGAYNPAET